MKVFGFWITGRKSIKSTLQYSLILCAFVCMFLMKATAQITYNEVRVVYDSAWTFKNLQLIPVRFKSGEGKPTTGAANDVRPISLSEALQKHRVKLEEIQYEKGADVNWLQLTNHSKQDVVIQSGEILDGGKQDRMVAETKIIAAGSTDYVNVYCVEKRRWSKKAKGFKTAGVANSDLQKMMNLKSRQSEVWKEIDRQFAKSKKTSETVSYVELYENATKDDSDYIRYFVRRYTETDSNYAGFIFLSGNKILSTELFATAKRTSISYRNMLHSYVQTARLNGGSPNVPTGRTKGFMDKVLLNEPAQKLYVANHGKLQLNDGKIVHIVAYEEEK